MGKPLMIDEFPIIYFDTYIQNRKYFQLIFKKSYSNHFSHEKNFLGSKYILRVGVSNYSEHVHFARFIFFSDKPMAFDLERIKPVFC